MGTLTTVGYYLNRRMLTTIMRKNVFVFFLLAVFAQFSFAVDSFEISGVVRDPLGHPVEGARIQLDSTEAAQAGPDGVFRILAAAGSHTLRITHGEFQTWEQGITVNGPVVNLSVTMEPLLQYPESIVVQAIRADDNVPVTKTNVNEEQIKKENYGQEMPFLLSLTPSITSYADSGMGAGYSYFYLRGVQQTRINMTLDGVPLNDPEESAVYFSNYGDFNNAVQSIQVQRGVGTSTLGSSSYGGSINFESVDPTESRGLLGEIGVGSFGSNRAAIVLDSGRFNNGLALYGRFSYQDTDGFKEHSGVNQRTLYYGGTWQNDRSFLKFFGFSGRERTQLAYLATEESILQTNLRYNALQPEERDHFGQDLFQVQYTHLLGSSSSFAAQAYYNGAQGWFTIWDDPVAKTNLLKYSIDGYFVGSVVTYSAMFNNFSVTAGGNGNYFVRDHFQDIRDVQQYVNTGRKNDANAFVKVGYQTGRWHLYGDAQVRYAMFRYIGDLDLGSINWTFFNPKIGAHFDVTDRIGIYASVGRTSREPARSDLLLGEDNATVVHDFHAVKPESVNDFEAGLRFATRNMDLQADFYAMEFRNEIALTGELSDIGLPLRKNVDRSFRRGVELDFGYQATSQLRLVANANLSYNRIRDWTQFYDVYDEQGNYVTSEPRVHHNVNPLLTPNVIFNQGVEYKAADPLILSVNGKYVSQSYLDNTNNNDFRTPAFFNMDAGLRFNFSHWWRTGSPSLRLQVNNVLNNKKIWPSGYSYLYFIQSNDGSESLQGIPYYYPLATRSAFVALDFQL